MGKSSTLDSFFKRKTTGDASTPTNVSSSAITSTSNVPSPSETPTAKFQRIDDNEFDVSSLPRDPGMRRSIWDYSLQLHDEIRRAYITLGPYQPTLQNYPKSGAASHQRSFQPSYFKKYHWIEYSPTKDVVFCLPCYLFSQPSGNCGHNTFISEGFRNWKKVGGKDCVYKQHVGNDVLTCHKVCEQQCDALMNQSTHIVRAFESFKDDQKITNRLQLKATIDTIRYLGFQGLAFRGHDERVGSTNRGNFLEMLSMLSLYDKEVGNVVEKASKNALYNLPNIQKEICHCFASRVKKTIREEIGDAKFCLLIDEARDVSNKEQMSLVLRFVDQGGFVKERFFGLIHVPNTTAAVLKDKIYSILSNHALDVQNIRGQGYDGASNMRGEWNGLQALISRDCPYAYYIHCFAHRLQLALVAASKDVILVNVFFTKLMSIINIVSASTKRSDELKAAHASDIASLISFDELETESGFNQIGSLQRAMDTRWSSHYRSICSLKKMFSATCKVLITIMDEGNNSNQRADANVAYESLTTFEFVFILHLMERIMEITNIVCLTLQSQTQDVLNAMEVVSTCKHLLQQLRDEHWDSLLANVITFCQERNIDVPNMHDPYLARGGRARHQHEDFTVEHHYRVDIFYAVIDSQLQELSFRFNENAMDLLVLSSSLNPLVEDIKIDDLCRLVHTFYPKDFTEVEKSMLEMQFRFYAAGVVKHTEYKKLSSISELCQWLVKTKKSITYPLVFRVIVLILTLHVDLTLHVSTATTEKSFLAMSMLKTRLRNKMEDMFLSDSMFMYIEKEIADQVSADSIIDDFRDMKERRVPF